MELFNAGLACSTGGVCQAGGKCEKSDPPRRRKARGELRITHTKCCSHATLGILRPAIWTILYAAVSAGYFIVPAQLALGHSRRGAFSQRANEKREISSSYRGQCSWDSRRKPVLFCRSRDGRVYIGLHEFFAGPRCGRVVGAVQEVAVGGVLVPPLSAAEIQSSSELHRCPDLAFCFVKTDQSKPVSLHFHG